MHESYEGVAPAAILDRVRLWNRQWLNPLVRRAAGRMPGPLVLLSHRGRRSGRIYRVPVVAQVERDYVLIPLTYGSRADWLQNTLTSGRAALLRASQTLTLDRPRILRVAEHQHRFPLPLRLAIRLVGIRWLLEMRRSR